MDFSASLQNEAGCPFRGTRILDSGLSVSDLVAVVWGAASTNSQLRQVAEVYAAADGRMRLVHDFVAAWHNVMMLDRYDVKRQDGKLRATDVQTVL